MKKLFIDRIRHYYNFLDYENTDKDILKFSEGIYATVFIGGISIPVMTFVVWFIFMRANSEDPVTELLWYVLFPLGFFLVIAMTAGVAYAAARVAVAKGVRKLYIYEEILTLLYVLMYCGEYIFLRNFDMAFLLFFMPIIMMVIRRGRIWFAIEFFLLILIFFWIQMIPSSSFWEPAGSIPPAADMVCGVYLSAMVVYVLMLAKDSSFYSFRKNEADEDRYNIFIKYIMELNHDVRTPIHSIEGMSEMILRSNVSDSTSKDIVIIRESADKIISAVDKVIEFSRIEMSNDGEEELQTQDEHERVLKDGEARTEDRPHTYLYAPKAQVLAADDSILNLNVIRALLARTGIRLDCAMSGYEALKLVSYNYYDVILLDHMMPGMDGIETLSRIKANPGANFDTPVIVITANDIRNSVLMYKKVGFADCIEKPLSGEQLEAVLEKYLPPHLISRREME